MGSTEELLAAIATGDVDAVRALLAKDASLGGVRDRDGVSVLMRARYRRDGAMVQAILAASSSLDVFEAAAFGDLDRLAELLDADPSSATSWSGDGFSTLHLAAFFGNPDAANLLLGRGADVDARGRGWMTGTPLHSSVSARHADVARILLDAGADPNARQSGGWSPLHSAVANGDVGIVELLMHRGADAALANDEGVTAISIAEEGGDAAVLVLVRPAGE